MSATKGSGWAETPGRPAGLDANRFAALRMRLARESFGWTQAELAERLGWPRAAVGYAERSADEGTRYRRFDVADIAALARVFELPVTFFFAEEDGWADALARAIKRRSAERIAEAERAALERVAEAERAALERVWQLAPDERRDSEELLEERKAWGRS